ncbi:MAG: amidohydrolase family protein, partial [Bradyrhizobium sp.]
MEPAVVTSEGTSSPSLMTRRAKPPPAEKVLVCYAMKANSNQSVLRTLAKLGAGAGWQVAVHAIGDAAGRAVLDAFAAMPTGARAQTRPRLEHCQMLTP